MNIGSRERENESILIVGIHGQDNWVRLSNKIKDKTPKNLGR